MNIGHFRAPDTLVDPADDIAENSLRVVAKLLPDVILRPVRPDGDRDRQDVLAAGAVASCQFGLPRGDIDLVVMKRVQCRRRR